MDEHTKHPIITPATLPCGTDGDYEIVKSDLSGATVVTGYGGASYATGDYGTAVSGMEGASTVGKFGTAMAGYAGNVRGGEGSALMLQIRSGDREIVRWATAYVGEDGVEPGLWYRYDDERKQFVLV